MLPYSALWNLDQQMHPSAPRRRTRGQRRRQTLTLCVMAIIALSIFLVPFHVTHLRRIYISKLRMQDGLGDPQRTLRDISELESEARGALLAGEKSDLAWRRVFYLIPFSKGYDGFMAEAQGLPPPITNSTLAWTLSGAGAGTHWPYLK